MGWTVRNREVTDPKSGATEGSRTEVQPHKGKSRLEVADARQHSRYLTRTVLGGTKEGFIHLGGSFIQYEIVRL